MRPLSFLSFGLAGALLLVGGLPLAGCQSSTPSSAPPTTPTAKAPPPSRTFQPGPGVECDRRAKVCRYDGTASSGLTRLHFGDGAAEDLMRPPAPDPTTGVAASAPSVADPIFKPTTRQSCDTLVVTCYDEEGANVDLTKARFGDDAATRLQTRKRTRVESQRVIRYGGTITCDNLAEVCYDRLGAGYGVTRLYLGEAQADRLLQRLRITPPS